MNFLKEQFHFSVSILADDLKTLEECNYVSLDKLNLNLNLSTPMQFRGKSLTFYAFM